MTLDFQIVTTVKTEFARRLPSELVTLVLEFANEANAELKRAYLDEFAVFVRMIAEKNQYEPRLIRLAATIVQQKPIEIVDALNLHHGANWSDHRNLQWRKERPDLDIKIEPDYVSCMHPTTLYYQGTNCIINSLHRQWTIKFEKGLSDNKNFIPHPHVRQVIRV